MSGVGDDEQGLASGLFNTTEQVGAGIVLAIAVAASSMRTTSLGGLGGKMALTGGLQSALLICIASVFLSLPAVFVVIQKKRQVASATVSGLADPLSVGEEECIEDVGLC